MNDGTVRQVFRVVSVASKLAPTGMNTIAHEVFNF